MSSAFWEAWLFETRRIIADVWRGSSRSNALLQLGIWKCYLVLAAVSLAKNFLAWWLLMTSSNKELGLSLLSQPHVANGQSAALSYAAGSACNRGYQCAVIPKKLHSSSSANYQVIIYGLNIYNSHFHIIVSPCILAAKFLIASNFAFSESQNTNIDRFAYLCDTFGPRYVGTPALDAALGWIVTQMKEDGKIILFGDTMHTFHWIINFS